MKKFFENLISLLFPPRCCFCGGIMGEGSKVFICKSCDSKITYTYEKHCQICCAPLKGGFSLNTCAFCNRRRPHYKKAFVPLIYEDLVRKSIIRYKFRGKISYSKTFAFLIADKIIGENFSEGFDIVTSIPQNPAQSFFRGFNPARLLAKEVALFFNAPYMDTLNRSFRSKKQSRLKYKERLENAKKSYSFKKSANIKGKIVLLVDDILTTGATLDTCAKILLDNGAKEVYVAALARTGYSPIINTLKL
ncbi:MAG: ComF family protein [Clostridiaceae bacterium]|mgnify:CR=1 FL=1|nr:ComF family protein [Clostridiaceae bacterium]